MTSAPNVMLGTNWPSMTSNCMRSKPAFSSSITPSARRPRSIGSTDGTIAMGCTTKRYAPRRRPTLDRCSDSARRLDGRRRRRRSHETTTAGSCSSTAPFPGELVDVEVFEEHIDYAKATVVSVEEPVAGRVAPPCPYVAAGCGGCGWQHIDPAVQVELKREIVLDALRRIGRLANRRRRRRPGAAADGLPDDGAHGSAAWAAAAFRTHRSHDLVDIDECLVAHPLLADLIRDGRYGDAREVVAALWRRHGRAARARVARAREASTSPTTWCSSGRTR